MVRNCSKNIMNPLYFTLYSKPNFLAFPRTFELLSIKQDNTFLEKFPISVPPS